MAQKVLLPSLTLDIPPPRPSLLTRILRRLFGRREEVDDD